MRKLRMFSLIVVVVLSAINVCPKAGVADDTNSSPLEVIKNIEFKNIKLSLGGDYRVRYEYREDFDFDTDTDDRNGFWYARARLNLQAKIGKKAIVFFEGLDAREWESDRNPRAQEDNFDFHRGYLKLSNLWDMPLSLKIGRQKFKFGAKRLIGSPVWANKVRSFDAVRLAFNPADFDVDLFLANRVGYQDDHFNDCIWGENLFGIYTTYKGLPGNVFDFYSLNLVDKRHHVAAEDGTLNDLERYTVGHRGEGKFKKTSLGYGYEFAYQFGEKSSDHITAYAYHLDVNYTFKKCRLQPKITLEYNYATGDENPNDGDSETFVPLFQTVHGPYGIMDFFRWQNVKHWGFWFDFIPVKNKVKCSLQYHWFYLDEVRDAWYNTKGKVVRRDTTGRASDHVGNEVDLVVKYTVNKFLTFEGGYAHFFADNYVEDTGSADDADWFYLQTAITF